MDFVILPGPIIEDSEQKEVCQSILAGIVLNYRKIYVLLFNIFFEKI